MSLAELTLLLGLLLAIRQSGAQEYLHENYPATVIEDAYLDTAQLLRKYNYPEETHYVTTEDKYILRMHRMPRPGAPPVFLMHGLLDSSSLWILMGPWSALAYYLYDNGYDVWMGNARGNRYSRNHTTLNPDTDLSFWTFSWHEIAMNDLPVMIDYVLQQTNRSRLAYYGHSQGTTTFWVMASLRPEMQRKIAIMSAVAPVAFMKNIKAPMMGFIKNFLSFSRDLVREFLPHTKMFLKSCFTSKRAVEMCLDSMMLALGKDRDSVNMTMTPVIFSHLPAGCNLRQMKHYVQLVRSGRFCQYDFGPVENMRRYGKAQPSDYPIQNIKVPVALYYAQNDNLSNDVDVQQLAKMLPNVVEDHLFSQKKWNHMSMLWGITARALAMPRMLHVMRKHYE